MLEDLAAFAMLGASRSGRASVPLAAPADEAAASLNHQDDRTRQFLDAAALAFGTTRAGVLLQPVSVENNPSPPDELSPCSGAAAQLINELFSIAATPLTLALRAQWLEAAYSSKCRLPHELLPIALDHASQAPAHREQILRVVDQRGRWLMKFSPRWSALMPIDPSMCRTRWEMGTTFERLAALKMLRQLNSEESLALLRDSWSTETAEDRIVFIQQMQLPLTEHEAAFLEEKQTDRSRFVRHAAATVLLHIPTSSVARRMLHNAEGLLRMFSLPLRGKRIDVTLPPESFDPDPLGDGLIQKPPQGTGRRQFWLRQIIGMVPPSHWCTTFGLTAPQCLHALAGEFADVVISAWQDAARRFADPQWSHALITAALHDLRGDVAADLVQYVEVPLKAELLIELVASSRVEPGELALALQAAPTSTATANAILSRLLLAVTADPGNVYRLVPLVQSLSFIAPFSMRPDLEAFFSGPGWLPARRAIAELFHTLNYREKIRAAFA